MRGSMCACMYVYMYVCVRVSVYVFERVFACIKLYVFTVRCYILKLIIQFTKNLTNVLLYLHISQ